jgi:hypothetical protein
VPAPSAAAQWAPVSKLENVASISDTRRGLPAPGIDSIQYDIDDLTSRKGLYIYDKMRRDPQVAACLQLIKSQVLGQGWSIRPKDDSPEALRVAQRVQEDLEDLEDGGFQSALQEMLLALDYGFSVTECIWAWDDITRRIRLNRLLSVSPHQLILNQTPSGRLASIDQWQGRGLVNLGPLESKFIYICYRGEYGNARGISAMREAYTAWFAKQMTQAYLSDFSEALSNPPVLAKTPANTGKVQADAVLDVISRLQAKTAMILPGPEWDVKLLESSKTPSDMFIAVLRWHDEQICKVFGVPSRSGVASTDGAGSYGMLAEQNLIFAQNIRLKQAWFASVLRKQLLAPMTHYSFGPQWPVPYMVLETPSESNVTLSGTIISGINAGAIERDDGAEGYLRSLLGVPPKEPATTTPAQASAPPTKPSAPPSQPPSPRPAPMVGSKFTAPILKG